MDAIKNIHINGNANVTNSSPKSHGDVSCAGYDERNQTKEIYFHGILNGKKPVQSLRQR